jgi:hypothetical protein
MKAYRVAFTIIVDDDFSEHHPDKWLKHMVDCNHRVIDSLTYSFKELPYDNLPDSQMNLYLLTQNQNNGYETYDSLIVAAPDIEDARLIGPNPDYKFQSYLFSAWANESSAVEVTLIGVAAPNIKRGVVLASFNAG